MDPVSYPPTGQCWMSCGRTGPFVKTFKVGRLPEMHMYLCRWCKGALTRARNKYSANSASEDSTSKGNQT